MIKLTIQSRNAKRKYEYGIMDILMLAICHKRWGFCNLSCKLRAWGYILLIEDAIRKNVIQLSVIIITLLVVHGCNSLSA